jgi:hypothetical protein
MMHISICTLTFQIIREFSWLYRYAGLVRGNAEFRSDVASHGQGLCSCCLNSPEVQVRHYPALLAIVASSTSVRHWEFHHVVSFPKQNGSRFATLGPGQPPL